MKRLARRPPETAARGVFLYAGALKALDPAQFAHDIALYRLVPPALVAPLALTLPCLEILAGGALALGLWRRGALLLLLPLSLAFLAIVGITWARGLDIACGCFGTGGSSLAVTFLRDLGLVVLLGWIAWRRLRHPSLS